MSALTGKWECPLCLHENVRQRANKRPRLSVDYCDDAQDNGCGEGPFLLTTELAIQVDTINNQNYAQVCPGHGSDLVDGKCPDCAIELAE